MPLPKIQFALNGWEVPVTLEKITSSTIVDFEKVNIKESINFQGVVQPLTAEALKMKPLETRSWEWLMIHTRTSVEIVTGDLIEYEGKEFKVMFDKNYSSYNYYEYHLVKNYE